MIKHLILILLTLFGFTNETNAQIELTQEIGIVAGPVQFRSDYGQSNDFSTNNNNTGFGAGIVHYLGFESNSYFGDHFKMRSEISYNKTNLTHFGKWVDNKSTSPEVAKLRAMRGSTSLLNLGTQLEYHFLGLHDFENTIGGFSPYVSLGAQISYNIAKSSSTLGDTGIPATTIPKYLSPSDGHPYGFSNESKVVLSVVTSLGSRYRLSRESDLLIDLRLQYFNSDWIDGLNPNKKIYTENKANDCLLWLNLGYIYYLEY